MKNDLTCAVVEDLLPSFVEGLTAPETNEALERHLAGCPACSEKRAAMGQPEREETAREVDYLKTVKRRGRKRVALAVLCTIGLFIAGIALKIFVIGTPLYLETLYTSMMGVKDDTLELALCSSASGNAYHSWKVENQDGVVSITAREVLVSPLFSDGTKNLEIPLEGVQEVWLRGVSGRLLWQDGMMIQSLDTYETRTPYVGDPSALGTILDHVGIAGYFYPRNWTMELHTSDRPYRWTINLGPRREDGNPRADSERMLSYYAPLLLALVGNLDEVEFRYEELDGTPASFLMTTEQVNALLPELTAAYNAKNGTDWAVLDGVKAYIRIPADFQRLCHLLLD